MTKTYIYFALALLALFTIGVGPAAAQQNLAQQTYAIFQQNCLICHGEHGHFTEALVIDSASGLIESGAVMPGVRPINSELYARLLDRKPAKRMPLNQPPLSAEEILTIGKWIQAGAPSWDIQHEVAFITPDAMLTAIEKHLEDLDTFDKPSARYFTTTHLYNAGEGPETLRAAEIALSKLVNSLSWSFDIVPPVPIDTQRTIFYIDLRDYEWDFREVWPQIEAVYPYTLEFNPDIHTRLHEKLTGLQEDMACEVPFVQADWFLATASLPPLYHDILGLPETDRELEQELGIDVARNLLQRPGSSVWRAGTNDSGVSEHNRVVERHKSRYGAYWKSYDFAGSVGTQNIFTHPLAFKQDGGEIIFNLPNGLQAYYISDGDGNRIDAAPTEIVSNPAASDPAVRNGLSCIGCHTEGMKTFEDGVRAVILETDRPAYDKDQALRLYVEQAVMDTLVAQDRARYEAALEKTGGVSGGIEPVHLFYEAFQGPLDARHAAASIGIETEALLEKIGQKPALQNLGLTGLLSDGNVKRDVWDANFSELVSCLYGEACDEEEDSPPPPDDLIPDENLRAAVGEALGKAPDSVRVSDLGRLTQLIANGKGIRDLTGLEHAVRLERIELEHNAISDLSPLVELVRLNNIQLLDNQITDVSPLAGLIHVGWLGLGENDITDLSPLSGLVKLKGIWFNGNPVSDVSPLASLLSLEAINAGGTSISDISGVAELTQLTHLELHNNSIADISSLANLKALTHLNLSGNLVSDVSSLSDLTRLRELYIHDNLISDVSPLAELTNLKTLNIRNNAISDFSPLKTLAEKIYIQATGNTEMFQQGGPKITGPWLWVQFPGLESDAFRRRDLLAGASAGEVTELEIATNGAMEGASVGNQVWTPGTIEPDSWNNIGKMLGTGGGPSNIAYGSIILDSPREQETRMFAGSNDHHKIWLNGELVDEKFYWNWVTDYERFFPVTLKQGKNVLLVAVYKWDGFVQGHYGFAPDAEYTVGSSGPRFTLSTPARQLEAGDTFTLHLTAANVTDLAGWRADITFDPTLLKANRVTEGSFLKQGREQPFFLEGTIQNKRGRITGITAARTAKGGANGEGTLLSIRFTALASGQGRVALRNFRAGTSTGETISATPPELVVVVERAAPSFPAWDVNEDGITDAADAQLVTDALGQRPPKNPRTDVNQDGVVNGEDLALVAAHLGERAAPAAPMETTFADGFTPESVEHALDILRRTDDGSLTFRRAIANLERILARFVPEETALLANYPNPFNPETWIPYQLSEPAAVTVHIYAASGVLVRTLALGHQPAGLYQYRSRAAYWDGRNAVGEPVASGVYFYTLTAGDFTATRKMLIRK